jgi:hypothetical protein
LFLCLGDRNHRERSGTRTDRERGRSAGGERLAGDRHGSKAKKKSKKRQAPSASSSDSEHDLMTGSGRREATVQDEPPRDAGDSGNNRRATAGATVTPTGEVPQLVNFYLPTHTCD